MLSEKQLQLRRRYYGAAEPYSKKLVCSLLPKKHYVVYGEMLRFYVERGMRITKVHTAIRFETKAFMKEYIQFNTNMRAQSKGDECLRQLFKLLNNSVYGKMIENVLKRTMIKLFTDMDKAQSAAEKPHCIDFRVFKEDLVGVELRKVNQVVNKPFQTGFAILEWSKLHMYRSYATLKDQFKDKMRLLYTDTDSMIFQVFTKDLYREILNEGSLRPMFDFSEIPADHPSHLGCPTEEQAGQVGYFKDEQKGNPIIEFVALKPKMYSLRTATCLPENSKETPKIWSKQVGKGIARAALKTFTFEMYKDMFDRRHVGVAVSNCRIGSKLHEVLFCNIAQY